MNIIKMRIKNILIVLSLVGFFMSPEQVEIRAYKEPDSYDRIVIRFNNGKEIRVWLDGNIQPSLPFFVDSDRIMEALKEFIPHDSATEFLIKSLPVDECKSTEIPGKFDDDDWECVHHRHKLQSIRRIIQARHLGFYWYPMSELESKIEDEINKIMQINEEFEADWELMEASKTNSQGIPNENKEYLDTIKFLKFIESGISDAFTTDCKNSLLRSFWIGVYENNTELNRRVRKARAP